MSGARFNQIVNCDVPQVAKPYLTPTQTFGGNLVYIGSGAVQVNGNSPIVWRGGYVAITSRNLASGNLSGELVQGFIDSTSGKIALRGVIPVNQAKFPTNSIPLFIAGCSPSGLVVSLTDMRPLPAGGNQAGQFLTEVRQDPQMPPGTYIPLGPLLVHWKHSYDVPQCPLNYGYPIPQPGSFSGSHTVFIGPSPNRPIGSWLGPFEGFVSPEQVSIFETANGQLMYTDGALGRGGHSICTAHLDAVGRVVGLEDTRQVQ